MRLVFFCTSFRFNWPRLIFKNPVEKKEYRNRLASVCPGPRDKSELAPGLIIQIKRTVLCTKKRQGIICMQKGFTVLFLMVVN